MNYNQIQSILINDEVNHISDCDVFFDKEKMHDPHSIIQNTIKELNHEFVLFEYTIDNWNKTIDILKDNKVNYSVMTDVDGYDFILI